MRINDTKVNKNTTKEGHKKATEEAGWRHARAEDDDRIDAAPTRDRRGGATRQTEKKTKNNKPERRFEKEPRGPRHDRRGEAAREGAS